MSFFGNFVAVEEEDGCCSCCCACGCGGCCSWGMVKGCSVAACMASFGLKNWEEKQKEEERGQRERERDATDSFERGEDFVSLEDELMVGGKLHVCGTGSARGDGRIISRLD